MIDVRLALQRLGSSPLARRSALCSLVLGLAALAGAGCSSGECERDSDCPSNQICATNRPQNRCVPDPYAGLADAGVDSGIDGSVLPSNCASATDTFDRDAVYLLGSVPGAACSPNAMAALSSPDVESVGFGCGVDAQNVAIRPSDGRLVYLDGEGGRLLVFRKDDYSYDSGTDSCTYPANPAGNDQTLATTSCNASLGGPSNFLFAPDREGFWYTCTNASGLWFDQSHDLVKAVGTLLPLLRGYGGSMLAGPRDSPRELVLSIGDGTSEIAIGGGLSEEGRVLAMRALDDGFWIALQSDGESSVERLLVGLDGSVASEGEFPALPANVSFDAAGAGHALDGSGALYAAVVDRRQGAAVSGVARLALDGGSEVVYSESDAPEVTAEGAALVTVR